MDELDMNIFIDGEFEDNEELALELQQINPSEDGSPESVASSQDGKAPQQEPSIKDDDDEGEEDQDDPIESKTKTSLYSSLANVLYDEGVLPNLDLKEKKVSNLDDLVEAIKTEIKLNEFSGLNDRQRRYLEAIRDGIPEEVFMEVEANNFELDQITEDVLETEENADVRESVIKQYFLLRGFDEEEAETLTRNQMDLATDIEFSKKAVKVLKNYNQARLEDAAQAIREQQAAHEAKIQELDTKINSTNKLIDGMPIDDKAKKEIKDIIFKPVATLPDGSQINRLMKAQMENPVDFQYKLAYLMHLTKDLTDFSVFTTVKKAKSSAAREFDEILKKSTGDLAGDLFDSDSLDLGKDFILDL